LVELEQEVEDALREIQAKWEAVAQDTTTISITPTKSGINVALFGVAWLPHHIVQADNEFTLLPAFA
jgi:hypothetical protein